ncbi:hypothetical protein UAO_00061 [Enterococcus villorum ATCC 700913]|nr:hypothetical protein UAO_00061 [Enterococcus villorum ATCC 700913]EOW77046.1 hypothetical protein I591_02367 [Enterococcus villorum ATCC 700913]
MVSLYNFNCKTMFAIICPITSTVKKLSIRYSLPEDLDTNVKVLISQLKAFDFKKENEEKSKV